MWEKYRFFFFELWIMLSHNGNRISIFWHFNKRTHWEAFRKTLSVPQRLLLTKPHQLKVTRLQGQALDWSTNLSLHRGDTWHFSNFAAGKWDTDVMMHRQTALQYYHFNLMWLKEKCTWIRAKQTSHRGEKCLNVSFLLLMASDPSTVVLGQTHESYVSRLKVK